MSSNLSIFNFQNNPVKIITIENEPWFVANEIASLLGYSNTRDAINTNVEEEDTLVDASLNATHSLSYQTKLINESGLYSLIFSSKLEKAKEFRRWVTKEVLPSHAYSSWFWFDRIINRT